MKEDDNCTVITQYRLISKVRRVFQEESSGRWFVHFEGSTESFSFGKERPDFQVGDLVDIIFRKRKQT